MGSIQQAMLFLRFRIAFYLDYQVTTSVIISFGQSKNFSSCTLIFLLGRASEKWILVKHLAKNILFSIDS
jgi:hypothetical protein